MSLLISCTDPDFFIKGGGWVQGLDARVRACRRARVCVFCLNHCILQRGKRFVQIFYAGHLLPASEMPLQWHFAGGPMMV